MTVPRREAAPDYSRATQASRRSRLAQAGLRLALFAAAVTGAGALVFATFTNVIEIKVGTTTDLAGRQAVFSGFDRHSVALLLIALVALPMALGARRGSRPAMALLVVLAAGALVIAVALDLPDLHATGQIGREYADASAGPGDGYYAEALGGVLLLLAGGGMLLLAGGRSAGAERLRRRREPDPPAGRAAPAEPESWL